MNDENKIRYHNKFYKQSWMSSVARLNRVDGNDYFVQHFSDKKTKINLLKDSRS